MTETDQLLPALAKAQASYPTIKQEKTGREGNREYKYTDMRSLMESVRGPNTAEGLMILHLLGIDANGIHYSESRLYHTTSGQYLASQLRLDPDLSEKSLGKAITYARRYCTLGLMGIVPDEDTDGQEAEDEQRQRSSVRASTKPPAKPATKAAKEDEQNTRLQIWWTSVLYVMTEGGTITDAKTQRETLREMVGAMGYESTKELSVKERNALLAEVKRLYGPNEGEHTRPMGVEDITTEAK